MKVYWRKVGGDGFSLAELQCFPLAGQLLREEKFFLWASKVVALPIWECNFPFFLCGVEVKVSACK